MRILLDYRPALRQRTGVGGYIHETARALVASAPADESLVLFSASWRDRLAPDAVPGAQVVDRPVPVRLLNAAWHRLEWPPVEALGAGPLDVVHSAHPLLIPSRTAARLVTIHDLDFLDHPERTRAEIRRDYPVLARRHARHADQVVVVSRHTAADVEARLQVPRDSISICVPGAPEWPPRVDEPCSDACVLFLGTLEPRKNLDVLLDAYARLLARRPDAPPLVLAGRVPPDATALVRRATAPPLKGRVLMPGYVDEAAKQALYRRAVVFVLPSHHEGFGLPVLEAMTIGVPVLAADRGALPEVIGSAGHLLSPDDPEAMARALDDLLASRALRDRMREAGWAQARTFTWRRTAEATREAWQRAVDHRARRERTRG